MLEGSIDGLGNIHTFKERFDESLSLLKQNNAKLISSRDLSYARIKAGKTSYLLDKYSITGENSYLLSNNFYTRESPIFSKDISLLVLNSPLQDMRLAKEIVLAHRSSHYLQLYDKEFFQNYLEQAENDLKKEPEEREVLILPPNDGPEFLRFEISKNKNFDVARGLFKDQAELYLNFLEEKYKIPSIYFYPLSNMEIKLLKNPVITELFSCGFNENNSFELSGENWDLDNQVNICGIEPFKD